MEWIVESRKSEQIKIFAELKRMFNAGGSTGRFKRLKPLKFRVDKKDWMPSAYNVFLKTNYFKLYTKKIDGNITWLAIARGSKRQYILEMKK